MAVHEEGGRIVRTGLVTQAEANEFLELARINGTYSLGSVVTRLAITVVCLWTRIDSMTESSPRGVNDE